MSALNSNKTGCRILLPDLRSSTADRSATTLATAPPMPAESVRSGGDEDEDRVVMPTIIRHITTPLECCTKFVRCFSIPFTVYNTSTEAAQEQKPSGDRWVINFTWRRIPESYEFGEEGWSSVGAPLNSLSGIYDLVNVSLEYRLTKEIGFDDVDEEDTTMQSAGSLVQERFQSRVGDYYACGSETSIWLTTHDLEGFRVPPNETGMHPVSQQPRLILILSDIKSQAFSDANIPTFFGAGFVCPDDTPYDRTLSIIIGLSICTLILLILLGLAISHVKDKDRSFKIVENRKDF